MVALANGLDFGTPRSLHSVVGLRRRDIDKLTRVKIKLRRVPVVFDRDKLANILHRHFFVYGTIVPVGIYVEPNFQCFEGYGMALMDIDSIGTI